MTIFHTAPIRRTLRGVVLAAATIFLFAACTSTPSSAGQAQTATASRTTQIVAATAVAQADLPTTCSTLTPAETEGPYFKAGSPDETSLAPSGTSGTRLVLTGYVVDANCRPITGALVDFWQANDAGQYDNSGYTLRGHQFSDENGRYQLTTIVPGLYPGRTRHIHVKVQAPGQPALTTQLYFPNEQGNVRDGIFQENGSQLLLNVQQAGDGGLNATFNFILAVP